MLTPLLVKTATCALPALAAVTAILKEGAVNSLGWPFGRLYIFPHWFRKDPIKEYIFLMAPKANQV